MKKWLAAVMAAGCILVGGFGVAHAADWYYIDDNSMVYKTDGMARINVKVNNVEGYTYIYSVEINRPEKTWTEVKATVYSQSGVALLTNNEKQKPMKIEKETIGEEVMQALWGK